jgi:hypothetical protein
MSRREKEGKDEVSKMVKVPSSVLHGAIKCGQKSFKVVWRCHQLLSGFLVNGHLPQVLHQSANNKGDEMILQTVHRSGIFLTAEENPRKSQLRDSQ